MERKKVVIYARVSSKEQEKEGYSIPAQIKLLKEYALKNDFDVVKVFQESETAKKAGRKSFNEMLAYLESNNINIILVEKTDRLYRNFKDYVILEDYDLEVHLVKEGTVLSKNSKSHDKFIHGIKVLMAKNYIDNLSEEVKKGLKEKVLQGYYPEKAPVGYINTVNAEKKKVIDINPKTAPLVKRLFELYASGVYSLEEIRKKLYKEGLENKGKPYSKPRLLYVLKDIFYIGKFKYNGVIYDGKHAPIVDVELFNKVQTKFNVPKTRTHNVEFAYSGLIRCGICGCQLTAELKKGKYIYYHCTGKRGGNCKRDFIREEKIEEKFLELLNRMPRPSKEVVEQLKQANKEIWKNKCDYANNEYEALTSKIKLLKKRLDNLYIDKVDGLISNEFYIEKQNEWKTELDEKVERLNQIEHVDRTFEENLDMLFNFTRYAKKTFIESDAKKKRRILKMIGSNFVYKEKELSIELNSVFNYLLNSSFSQNGARGLTKLELAHKFIINLKKVLNQDFVTDLKYFDVA